VAKTAALQLMKLLKYSGLSLFFAALALFTASVFMGQFRMTDAIMREVLSEQELANLEQPFREKITNQTFTSSFALGSAVRLTYEQINQGFRDRQEWDKVMYRDSKELAFQLTRAAAYGWIPEHKGLLFFLTFGLGIIGSLIFVFANSALQGPPGIKNNGIYHNPALNRGWVGILIFLYLVTFYVLLYYRPYGIVNWTFITDPVKQLFIRDGASSQWFLYGFLYCVAMVVMGIKMILKYRHSNYQVIRTIVVIFFQVVFAFLLVEIMPLFQLPAVDLKNAWPLDYDFLFEWNVQYLLDHGHIGKFIFIWGILLALVVVPVLVYFYGKRWYCSWVCGCGGLAETAGDPYRQLSSKKMGAWKLERWMIHGVLVFAVLMTVWTGYLTWNVFQNPEMESKDLLLGISAYDVREWYGFLIGSIFAGVIGTGFYPILGNRSWCRFGCPLAAYMGIVQRFKSRFRITTNGGQCISCGNCSTYCEQGIDVRAYAQKGQNIVRASCVGCGVCAAVCPRGVLKLENGPENNRFGNEGPIVLGNNGFELNP
jgi:ferredoxin-type protein NapH